MDRSRFMALLRWIAATIIAILILQLKLDFFESYLYDLRIAAKLRPAISPVFELIFIDKPTVKSLKQQPDLHHHAQLLQQLALSQPLAVVYVTDPSELHGSTEQQLEFVAAAKKLKNFFYVTKDLELKGEEGKLTLKAPFQDLKVFSGPLTTDSTVLAKDGVTRRLMLDYEGKLMLHPHLASMLIAERTEVKSIKGAFDFYGTNQVYVNLAPTGSFPRSSMISILEQKEVVERYKDKIIFIGNDLETTTKDYILTPYSREVTAMTTVEAHANMVDAVLRNDGFSKAPQWLNLLFTIGIAILTITIVMTLKPGAGLILIALIFGSYSLLSYLALWTLGLWLEMAHPFLAIFICYYFFIPYRLIIENRKSWEYQQKNQLLTQVEELKNNFISMMSHDLKTPLARIQGMAEILERSTESLNTEQQTAVKNIRHSSEDLLHFISSILDFSRIESQGVKLNLVSKDLNSLILDVIKKYDYLAKEKHIEVLSELEPLFSIQIDPALIRQIISNLLENAIKYSPEQSKVLITTEDRGSSIVLQVADQGPGIPEDELSSIFMKFFRSKSAKSSPIKGSGLGLYLTKYFVELHNGKISVESVPGQGSTFTVELPIGS